VSCARWKIIDDPLFWPTHGPQEPAASRAAALASGRAFLAGTTSAGAPSGGARSPVPWPAQAAAVGRGALTPSQPIAGRSPHF